MFCLPIAWQKQGYDSPLPRRPATHAAPALFRLLSDSSLSRAALNACGVPLALLEAEKRTVTYVNAAFAAYFGFSEGEALGKSLAALLLRGDEALAQRVLADCPSAWPLTAWRKDGAALQLSSWRWAGCAAPTAA